MAYDPRNELAAGASSNPMVPILAQLADQERRLRALEHAPLLIPVSAGPPTPDKNPRPGAPYADSAGNRLGLWINGQWRSVGLT